jgi:hypothetical protein
MKHISRGVLALPVLLGLSGYGFSQTISWPEAVAQLAGERAKAETCVALVKKYGDDAQIGRGQLTYTSAKADCYRRVDHRPFCGADAGKPVEPASQIKQRCFFSARILRDR